MNNALAELVEAWRVAARHAVELEEEADAAEAKRRAVRSELINHGEGAVAAREHMAECHPRYQQAVTDARVAKSRWLMQRVEAEAMSRRFDAARTMSANERAERRMMT